MRCQGSRVAVRINVETFGVHALACKRPRLNEQAEFEHLLPAFPGRVRSSAFRLAEATNLCRQKTVLRTERFLRESM